jgi:AraC-like DNA-binding protein
MGTRNDAPWLDLHTRRPERAQAILGDRFARHDLRVLSSGRTIDFALRQAQLDRIVFLQVSYGTDVEIVTSGIRDFYLLQLTLAGVCAIDASGERACEFGPGWLHVVHPGTAYRKRWSSDAAQLIVRVPRRPLELLAAPGGTSEPVVFTRAVEPVPATVSDLIQYCWHEVTAAGRTRSLAIDKSASRHLLTVILHSLPNSAAAVAAPQDIPACLIRADTYIRRNLTQPLCLDDITRAAGVRTRALESAFRRYWRTTPSAHVRNLRLEAAHHLLSHPVSGMTVTDVALATGFPHLGRFSRSYSARFGELPSESLRNAVNPPCPPPIRP